VLDRLELAAGLPLGVDAGVSLGVDVAAGLSVREALEAEVLQALRRPPCVVSFSGGRDSSAMLALAAAVARREGLPAPVAVTWRFPGVRSTDESDWQEMVIAYLGVAEWEVVEFGEELEVLGELATGVLRRHGLLWPASIHLWIPALQRARGGSVLDGIDARRLFDGWQLARARTVLAARTGLPLRAALQLGAWAALPAPLRRRVNRRERDPHFPGLRPAARRELVARGEGPLDQPHRWDRYIDWTVQRRDSRVEARSLAALAEPYEVTVVRPLLSPLVLAALADAGGAAGLGEGIELRRRLFGDLLPEVVLSRRPTTSEFGPVLWAGRSRAFAATWDGTGVDTDLIDVDRLAEIWRGDFPYLHASTVAQAVWLAADSAGRLPSANSPTEGSV
jgi:hypothetical protein